MRLLKFTKCSRLSSKCFRLEVDESGKQWRDKRGGDGTRERLWKGEQIVKNTMTIQSRKNVSYINNNMSSFLQLSLLKGEDDRGV